MSSSGVVKTSTLFGSPSGESPTDSNPFAFVTLNKPQSLEQLHQHSSPVTSGNTQNISSTTSGLDQLYGSQPFGVTNHDVVPQEAQEDSSQYLTHGSDVRHVPTSINSVFGSTQTSNGTDFFDSIPQVVPLHTQVSNPLQHQQLQGGGNLVNETSPFDVGQPVITGNEHLRHNSVPSMSYPHTISNTSSSSSSSGNRINDFYSGIQQQQPSSPAVSLEEISPHVSGGNRTTSASAPSTGVHPLRSLSSEHQLTSLPISLQPSQQQSNSDEPVPRPPSNADTAYTPHQNFNYAQPSSYPLTNVDVPDNTGDNHILTNATNAAQKPTSVVTPELNTNIYSTTLNQPSQLVPTHHTGLEEGEDPLPNAQLHEPAHNTSVLNDSLDNQSMSSLLQDNQEELSSSSPVRLLPPAPMMVPQTTSAPISLYSPVTQESLGGGLSLMPPAPLQQVLHPPLPVSTMPETPVSLYEPQTNATPLLTNATNKQQDIEESDWEIVDNAHVPPHAMVSNLYSQPPPAAHQASASDMVQQTTNQMSSLSLEEKVQPQQQQQQEFQRERGDNHTGSLPAVEGSDIVLTGPPQVQNVPTHAQGLQSSSQSTTTTINQEQSTQPSQAMLIDPIASDKRSHESQAMEEPSNLVKSDNPPVYHTNVTNSNANLTTPVVSTAPIIPPATSQGVAGHLGQMPPSNIHSPQTQVLQPTSTSTGIEQTFVPPSTAVQQVRPTVTSVNVSGLPQRTSAPVNITTNPESLSLPPAISSSMPTSMPLSIAATTEPSLLAQTTQLSSTQNQVQEPPVTVNTQQPLTSGAPPVANPQAHEPPSSKTSISGPSSAMAPPQRRDSDYHDGRPQYDAERYHQPPDYYHDRRDPYYDQRGGDVYHRDGNRDYYGGRQSHPSTYSERGPDQYGHDYHHQRAPNSHQYDYPPYPHHDYRDPYQQQHQSYRGRYGEYDENYHRGGGYRYGQAPVYPHHDGYGGTHSQYYDEHYHQGQYAYDDRYRGGYATEDHRYSGHYDNSHQHGGQYGDGYSTDPRYEYDSRYQPTSYSDQPPSSVGQHYQGSGYDSRYSQQQTYQDPQYGHQHNQQQQQQQEHVYQSQDFNPAEASAIYGGQNHFEISQSFIDSPNTRRTLPQHPQHESTAYLESTYNEEYHYNQEGYGVHQQHLGQYDYTDGQYQQQGDGGIPSYPQYYTQGDYGEENPPQEQQWAPVETTPPPPPRETPELFAHPHVRASFGFGGQLITILPNRQSTIVEVCSIRNVVCDPDSSAFVKAVNVAQGPFVVGDTPKSHVIKFASQLAQKCRDEMSMDPNSPGERETDTNLEDEALMWDFLVLLCQQNGVVLPSDVVDLLMKDRSLSISSSTHFGASAQEESLESLRQLLLVGRKKDALDLACSKSLWGHALMLASRMDEQSRTYVVNRFTASLMTTDPLSTFYTLLLGRSPSAVKPEGLLRAGDWRPHLAMILANRTSKLDNESIISLGDSLLAQGRLHAAHLCYHLANVHFGAYGNTETKYSLLGVDHTGIKVGIYPKPCDLQKMEVFEYAMSLNKQEFTLPYFQMFKYLYVLKLVEAGFVTKALKYCEQISLYVVKGPHSYMPTFLQSLTDLAVKLHHQNSPFGVVENELPSWLILLQQSVSEALANDYNPCVLSPSPAFSSVSQTYISQPSSQPIIGLQLQGPYLSVPATGGSSLKSSAVSSKEGSVVAIQNENNATKLNPTLGVHQLELYANTAQGQQQQQQQQQQEQPHQDQQQQTYTGYQGQEVQTLGSVTQYEHTGSVMQTQSTGGDAMFSESDQPVVAPSTQPLQQGEVMMNSNQPQAQSDFYSQYGQLPSALQSGVNTQPPPTDAYNQQMYTPDFGVANTQPSAVAPSSSDVSHQQERQILQDQSSQPVVPPLYDPTLVSTTTNSTPIVPPTGIGGVSADVSPYDYWQNLNPPSNEELQQRQHEQEASTPIIDGSGDSHKEPKKKEEESKEKEENSKGKGKKEVKQGQQSSGGGGWGLGLLKYIIPKKKNQAHLPDDKNPRIIWDKEKNEWVDLDADEKEQSGPAPPPTDSQLIKNQSQQPSQSQPGPPKLGGGGESTDGASTTETSVMPPPSSNMYSRQGSKRGRLGARSKYVDVLNPGGTSAASDSQPPPPGPPPMAAMMGGSSGQPFTGTFFVPQQAPETEQSSEGGTTVVAPTTFTVGGSSSNSNTEARQTPGQVGIAGSPPLDPLRIEDHHTDYPQNQPMQQEHVQQMFSVPQQQLQNQHQENQQQHQQWVPSKQGTVQASLPLDKAQHTQLLQEQRAETKDESSSSQQEVPPLPQFFNPSAFAPVNAFPPMVGGPGSSEPQDDSLSTVSLMSESSQEVSRYMNKQHNASRTTSAGYSRLQQGIRGVRGYPSKQVGGAQHLSSHAHQGNPPVPAGSTFQQRQ